MAIAFLRPNGDVSVGFTPLGGGTNHSEVSEVSQDEDSSYNFKTISGSTDRFSAANASIPTGSTITKVEVKLYARDTGGGQATLAEEAWHDGNYSATLHNLTTSYLLYSFDITGQESWLPADFDGGVEFGYTSGGGSTSRGRRVTQIWLEVEYTEPTTESGGEGVGEAVGSAIPTVTKLSEGSGKGESVGSAQPTVVKISPAEGVGEAEATAFGSVVHISPSSGIAQAIASAIPTLVKISRSSGKGSSKASAFGTVVHRGRAGGIGEGSSASPSTLTHLGRVSGIGDVVGKAFQGPKASRAQAAPAATSSATPTLTKLSRSSGVGSSRASAIPTITKLSRASGIGESKGIGFRSLEKLSIAKGKAESIASAIATLVKVVTAPGVSEAVAGARGILAKLSHASGLPESMATARGAVIKSRVSSGVGSSRASAKPTIIKSSRAGGIAQARSRAPSTLSKLSRASGVGEARSKAIPTEIVSVVSGRGFSRASAIPTIVKLSRASGVSEARAKATPPGAIITRSRSYAQASAFGHLVKLGRASGRGDHRSTGRLTRVTWQFDLIRGGTRYERLSSYLPREVDTDLSLGDRHRHVRTDTRHIGVDSRRWPALRVHLRIQDPFTLDWAPADLTGAEQVLFRMIDPFGNIVVHDVACAVVGVPTAGVIGFDWREEDVDIAGEYLGRFRVDWASHLEMPLYFPLKKETPVTVS